MIDISAANQTAVNKATVAGVEIEPYTVHPNPKARKQKKKLFMSSSHSKSTRTGLALHLLHLFRDLHVDFEELRHAAVDADGLALVEVAFQVGRGNTLLHAGVGETR